MSDTGSATVVYTQNGNVISTPPQPGITVATINYVTDTTGAISKAKGIVLQGMVVGFKNVPGATPPNASYAITIPDSNGNDIIAGLGASLATTPSTMKAPGLTCTDGTNVGPIPYPVSDSCGFTLAGGGTSVAGKTGAAVLLIKWP